MIRKKQGFRVKVREIIFLMDSSSTFQAAEKLQAVFTHLVNAS